MSVVEKKFLGVHQGPENVFVTLLGFINRLSIFVDRLAVQVTDRHIDLLLARQSCKRPIVEAVDFFGVSCLGILRQFRCASIFSSELFMDVLGVKQMQTLRETRLL